MTPKYFHYPPPRSGIKWDNPGAPPSLSPSSRFRSVMDSFPSHDPVAFSHAAPLARCPGRPWVMGIVNVTPDSFSGEGCLRTRPADTVRSAVRHGLRLLRDGADLLDLGAVSTRPGARDVPVDEEIDRLIPVLRALRARTDRPISVDTFRVEVARAAVEAGADIVNDQTALAGGWEVDFDDDASSPMARCCADAGAHLVLMHAAGSPEEGWLPCAYDPDGVVRTVASFLRRRAGVARASGMARERLWLDPGFGFGKSADDQARLLRALDAPSIWPVDEASGGWLVGFSRKRWIGEWTGRPVGERALGGVVLGCLAASTGAGMVRTHDVASMREALMLQARVLSVKP